MMRIFTGLSWATIWSFDEKLLPNTACGSRPISTLRKSCRLYRELGRFRGSVRDHGPKVYYSQSMCSVLLGLAVSSSHFTQKKWDLLRFGWIDGTSTHKIGTFPAKKWGWFFAIIPGKLYQNAYDIVFIGEPESNPLTTLARCQDSCRIACVKNINFVCNSLSETCCLPYPTIVKSHTDGLGIVAWLDLPPDFKRFGTQMSLLALYNRLAIWKNKDPILYDTSAGFITTWRPQAYLTCTY